MKLAKQIESLTTDELLAWLSNSLTVFCVFGFMAGMVLAFSLMHLNTNHSAFDLAAVVSALFLLGLLFWGHRFASKVVIPEVRKRYQNEKP
jgi:protein-S-isoprenylcysteine O-methyltransferase Ste14